MIVVDGKTGLLVPPRDPDALAAAIVDLMRDPARRRRWAARRAPASRTSSRSASTCGRSKAVFDEMLASRAGAGA